MERKLLVLVVLVASLALGWFMDDIVASFQPVVGAAEQRTSNWKPPRVIHKVVLDEQDDFYLFVILDPNANRLYLVSSKGGTVEMNPAWARGRF